jgi:ACR3 family arsenite transporter
MTKIEISELKKAVKSPKQTAIIVFFNYAVNPFLLFALGYVFFEVLFPSWA